MYNQVHRDDLVHANVCYDIVGVLMEVYKNLGSGYQEKYYQRAVAAELTNRGIKFQEQLQIKLLYKDKRIGSYFLDFLIEYSGVKVIVEIKKDQYFSKHHIDQVVGYLKSTGLELGILANFTPQGVKFKRVVNIK